MGRVRSRNTPGPFRCMQKKDLKLNSKIELAATIVKDKDSPLDETRDDRFIEGKGGCLGVCRRTPGKRKLQKNG